MPGLLLFLKALLIITCGNRVSDVSEEEIGEMFDEYRPILNMNVLTAELRTISLDPLWCAGQNLYLGESVSARTNDRPGLDKNVEQFIEHVLIKF